MVVTRVLSTRKDPVVKVQDSWGRSEFAELVGCGARRPNAGVAAGAEEGGPVERVGAAELAGALPPEPLLPGDFPASGNSQTPRDTPQSVRAAHIFLSF